MWKAAAWIMTPGVDARLPTGVEKRSPSVGSVTPTKTTLSFTAAGSSVPARTSAAERTGPGEPEPGGSPGGQLIRKRYRSSVGTSRSPTWTPDGRRRMGRASAPS